MYAALDIFDCSADVVLVFIILPKLFVETFHNMVS